jgi:hypothetical protein
MLNFCKIHLPFSNWVYDLQCLTLLCEGQGTRMWEAEKGEPKSKECIAANEHRKKLPHQNHYLQRVVWVYPDLHIPFLPILVGVPVNKAKSWWIKLVRMHVLLTLHQSGRWRHWKKCPCMFRNNFATKSFFCEQLHKLKERNKLLYQVSCGSARSFATRKFSIARNTIA